MGFADYGYGFAPLAPQFWGEQDFQAMQQGNRGFPPLAIASRQVPQN